MESPLRLTFDVPEPYNLWHSVRFQRMGKHDPRSQLTKIAYQFCSRLPSGPATASITSGPAQLHAELWGEGADELASLLGEQLGIHSPLVAADAPDLPKPLLKLRAAGLRRTQRGNTRVVETLIPIILQQLVTWREAAASWRGLLMRYGTDAPGPYPLKCPPTLETLTRLTLPDFRRLGVGAKRARTIQSVCATLMRYQKSPVIKQQQALLNLPGIGPWTLEFYRGLELGAVDAVPTGDYHLPSTVAWVLTTQRQATDEDMLQLLKPYQGYRFDILRLIMGANISAPRRSPRMPQRRTATV